MRTVWLALPWHWAWAVQTTLPTYPLSLASHAHSPKADTLFYELCLRCRAAELSGMIAKARRRFRRSEIGVLRDDAQRSSRTQPLYEAVNFPVSIEYTSDAVAGAANLRRALWMRPHHWHTRLGSSSHIKVLLQANWQWWWSNQTRVTPSLDGHNIRRRLGCSYMFFLQKCLSLMSHTCYHASFVNYMYELLASHTSFRGKD